MMRERERTRSHFSSTPVSVGSFSAILAMSSAVRGCAIAQGWTDQPGESVCVHRRPRSIAQSQPVPRRRHGASAVNGRPVAGEQAGRQSLRYCLELCWCTPGSPLGGGDVGYRQAPGHPDRLLSTFLPAAPSSAPSSLFRAPRLLLPLLKTWLSLQSSRS